MHTCIVYELCIFYMPTIALTHSGPSASLSMTRAEWGTAKLTKQVFGPRFVIAQASLCTRVSLPETTTTHPSNSDLAEGKLDCSTQVCIYTASLASGFV